MEEEFLIRSEDNYREIMKVIYNLMNKGEVHLTSLEVERLRK